MSRTAVWVCPDCRTALDKPEAHMCPHMRALCVPGFVDGSPLGRQDTCDECDKKTLVLNFTTTPSLHQTRRRERERAAEREKSEAARRETKEERTERLASEAAEREAAKQNTAEQARRLLAALKGLK